MIGCSLISCRPIGEFKKKHTHRKRARDTKMAGFAPPDMAAAPIGRDHERNETLEQGPPSVAFL
jgi:hypothetical protein